MRVSFIGIGAQKAASSWLHDILSDHPQVVMPAVKELDFFSYHYENGAAWYERQFESRPAALQVGEVSPSYLHEPAVIERARHYSVDLRIVVSLRDPVQRALSQHRHLVRLGMVDAADTRFESALARNPTYIEQGLYHHHLSRWFEAFGRARMHVVLMEDIAQDRAAVARDLYRFLGVNEGHQSRALNLTSNPSYVVKSAALDRSVRLVRRGMQVLGAGKAWRTIGNMGIRELYRRGNRRASSAVIPPAMPDTLRALRLAFREDTDKLGALIGRDLSAWRNE